MTLPGRPYSLVLLDRDGTLIESAPEGEYVTDPAAVRLLPGVPEAVRLLHGAGLALAVVTNQRCVARGQATMADVDSVHARVADLVGAPAGPALRWYVCPHEAGTCGCRKPLPGLVDRALAYDGVDPVNAVIVGDRESDVRAGLPGGLGRVLLSAHPDPASCAHLTAPDLVAAARAVLDARTS
jgi:D-glycero-D-manno-heptose 1,7-bisphosphate phosphatase